MSVGRISERSRKSVVTIGSHHATGGMSLTPEWIGTGFLVGVMTESENEAGKRKLYLVTNKHVVEGLRFILVRISPLSGGPSCDVHVPLIGTSGVPLYTQHPTPEIDIVAISIDKYLTNVNLNDIACFTPETSCLKIEQMAELGMSEGSAVYALGFPMSLVDQTHSYPICRLGCISRIEGSFKGLDPVDFLVDAQVFPGNSGGPVVANCPDGEGVGDTRLIGIVHSYIPYKEVLVSSQTGRPRSTMEENSGLSMVHPVDRILEAVKLEDSRIELSHVKRGAL